MKQRYKVWYYSPTQKWHVSATFYDDPTGMKRMSFIVAGTLDAAMDRLHARIIKYGFPPHKRSKKYSRLIGSF